jgi:glutamyl/glutaminyl-tRNA synthetase
MAKQLPPQRNSSTADNLAAWGEMQAGSPSGQQFCLRFRLDPTSENGALRDPVAWRGVDIPHYKTGVPDVNPGGGSAQQSASGG